MSIVDELKRRLHPDFLKYQVEGCTQDELDKLARIQRVYRLPQTYGEVMLFMGKRGLDTILDAYASVLDLREDMKEGICAELEFNRVAYPSDMFVFEEDSQAVGFRFFRTRDCENDPAVFTSNFVQGFRKLADSLSEYILWRADLYLMPDREARMRSSQQYATIRQTLYCYDATRDEMLIR